MSGNKTIIKSATAVVAVMLCSRVLGFLRQAIIAGVFGSNTTTDIYFTSSDFMLNLSGAFTTALTTALVTIYIAVAAKEGEKTAGRLASEVLTLFLAAAVVIILFLDIFASGVAGLLAPAYSSEQLISLAHYLRLFSAAFIFSAFQSIYAAVLNANDIFIPGKLYGVIFNPIAIFFVIVLGDRLGISSLVYAYYIANIVQCVFLHVRSHRLYSYRPTLNLKSSNVATVWRLALPVLISNVFIQLNSVLDKALCSYLGAGYASSYTYAYSLEQFVTGTFTTTIALILLSRFASLAAEKDVSGMLSVLRRSISAMVLILMPVMLITIMSSGDIVSLVYLRGEFTAEDASVTALALAGFAVGFPLVALREIFIRVHFAYQQTKKPMAVSLAAVILNAALSILLVRFIGIFGITLATSLAAAFSVILLVFSVKKILPEFRFFASWRTFLQCLAALAVCFAVLYFTGYMLSGCSFLIRTAAKIILGCTVYILVLLLLKCPELMELISAARTKMRRKT